MVAAIGIGNMKIKVADCIINLQNVLHVPELHMHFFSVNAAVKFENSTTFKGKILVIKNERTNC